MTDYDVIIVGAGPAGMTAAIYAARADCTVLLLDKLSPGGQIINTNEIQNYPGSGFIPGADLAIQMYEQTMLFSNITFDYRTVTAIEDVGDKKTVHCKEEAAVYTAKTLILAVGTRPRTLGVPGEDRFRGHGISWCAICDGEQYRGKDVVMIGGGNSAVQEALFLANITNTLTIVTMFDLTADPLACEKLRSMKNVTVYAYQEILEFTGEDRLTGVRFRSAKTSGEHFAACDGIFEYIGLTPMTNAFKALGILNKAGYIMTDSHMSASIPGIFAAGDCTDKELRQIVTACSDGAAAALQAHYYIQNRQELK